MLNLEKDSTTLIEQAPHHSVEVQKIISINKFMLLCFLTMGLYQIWWMFKAWRFFMQKDKLDIMPAFRAVFYIFFLYSLFKKINNYAKQQGYTENFSSGWMFIGFIFFSVLTKLPEPYDLITVLNFIFLILAFKALNFAKQQSNQFVVIEQKKFSKAQMVLIVFFSIFWCLYLLTLFLNPT